MILTENQGASCQLMEKTIDSSSPTTRPSIDRCNATIQRRRGFTLIEVLVVVAIIALLVAILLPSLSAAREQARRAVCLSNKKQIALALGSYMSANDGYFPGPNTTGYTISETKGYIPNMPGGKMPVGKTAPTYNMSWVPPLFGETLDFPSDRLGRYRASAEGYLQCPSNNEVYGHCVEGSEISCSDVTGHSDWPFSYHSYSIMLGFHIKARRSGGSGNNYDYGWHAGSGQTQTNALLIKIPPSAAPKIERVGTQSAKIFALEGARYMYDPNTPSFNTFEYQIQGGNTASWGPSWFCWSNSSPYYRKQTGSEGYGPGGPGKDSGNLEPQAYRYAFRHNKRINAVYFDGHAETLTEDQAIKLGQYFPRGTVISMSAPTPDPDVRDGQVIY